ncbi:MAG: LexA family transcriptional regulator [Rhizobiales bacterium]|nr:LexA family transcriptional regulator [Hyphomicrobiales bacterium]
MKGVAFFHGMGNRLKELRNSRGWTLERAADEMSVSRSQYIKLERGERRLTADYISKAAQIFGVTASDIISAPGTVAVMGYVGAGAEVEPDFEQVPPEGLEEIELPFPVPDDMIAFKVRGNSMWPVYKPDHIIVVFKEQRKPIESFYGLEAAVRTDDGRRFIKTVERGNGGVFLRSWNEPEPIGPVHLAWIGEIFVTLPPAAAKKAARVGGIQGQFQLRQAG